MDELKKLLSRINFFSALVDFFLKRAKLLEQSLKEKYSTVLRVGLLFASFLLLLGFYSLQRFENNIDIETEGQIIIENIALGRENIVLYKNTKYRKKNLECGIDIFDKQLYLNIDKTKSIVSKKDKNNIPINSFLKKYKTL